MFLGGIVAIKGQQFFQIFKIADVSKATGSDLHVLYIANLDFHDLTVAALAALAPPNNTFKPYTYKNIYSSLSCILHQIKKIILVKMFWLFMLKNRINFSQDNS